MLVRPFLVSFLALVCSIQDWSWSTAQDFEVSLLNGRRIPIESFQWNESQITIQTKDGTEAIPFQDMLTIQRLGVGSFSPAGLLKLVDGSEVAFSEIFSSDSGEQWELTAGTGHPLALPRNQAQWLLFRSPQGAEQDAWKQMLEEKQEADSIIISRGSGVIDRASGGIVGIEKDEVKFNLGLEGQMVMAPRAKLLGLLWFRKPAERIQPSLIVRTTDGSKWLVARMAWSERGGSRSIQLLTSGGVELSLPELDLHSVDFSSANLRWLSELNILERRALPRISAKVVLPGREEWLAPRFVAKSKSTDPKDLDLRFNASGEIVFRVPEGCRKFESRITRSSLGDARSHLELEIWEGDVKLWNAEMSSQSPPQDVSVEVHADKRLKLVMRVKSELMAGCEVTWLQPRFLR